MSYTEDLQRQIHDSYEEFKNQKLKIALIGQPGAGKSSLTNKILGQDVFRVSQQTDTTKDAESHEYGNLIITDLPGYGTKMFPVDKWVEQFSVSDYDLYIFVFAGKLHDSDSKLFEMLEKWKNERNHPYFIVRNKADDIWEDGKTDEELREIVRADVRDRSGLGDCKVYFTSCRKIEGIDELKEDIEKSKLDDVKKGKFVAAFKARSLRDLENKKAHCYDAVDRHAIAAAANGLNPIPGVDAAVDIGIVFDMFSDIRNVFDLDPSKTDEYMKFAAPVAKNVMSYVSKDQIAKYLSKYATEFVGKSVAKYFPFVGQAISVGISYFAIEKAGKIYVDNCFELAKEIMGKSIDAKCDC